MSQPTVRHPILSRRGLMASAAGVAAGLGAKFSFAADPDPNWKVKNGRINSSICAWCFKPLTLEQLCEAAKQIGLKSVELLGPDQLHIVKKHGLTCAMVGSHGLVKGFNHVENHAECIAKITKSIDAAAENNCPNVITFSGMREKISDEEGLKNTVAGLKKIVGYAEQKKVTLCIEVLNSRVDKENIGHPDYQCDRVEWAADVCKQVGSSRMKMLFDIYHVQIMQGDIITRIKEFKDYIGHYHTAGVPGRHELDDTQEINYPPIMKAILETGYTGFVGQEFIPLGADKIAALRQGVQLCDV